MPLPPPRSPLFQVLVLPLFFFLSVSSSSSSSSSYNEALPDPPGPIRVLFHHWLQRHNITLPPQEFHRRMHIFADNHAYIEAHNNGGSNNNNNPPSFKLGHNQFSHLTYEEFASIYLGWTRPLRGEDADEEGNTAAVVSRALRGGVAGGVGAGFTGPYTYKLPFVHVNDAPLPASIDWVEKGAVTKVKDQGSCGSCYSFSATGAVEGAYALATGTLLELSMQEIVDCDDLDGGCQGGEMQQTFKWIQENGGLCLLEDYPYVSGDTQDKQSTCQTCPIVPNTAPSSWKTVRRNSPSALMEALAQQPVSVAVGASRAWMFYESGVFDGKCEAQLNHGVLAVGYGEEEAGGKKYYKVKNSWSDQWGMQGYILLAREEEGEATGKEADKEACGILEDASFPILPLPVAAGGVAAVSLVTPNSPRSSKGSATAQDCGGGTASFPTIGITPEQVSKDQLVTVSASGVLNKPTFSGKYTLAVKYEGAVLYSHSGNACGNETVSLPLNAGVIHIFGFSCPANPGPVSYGLDVVLPSIAPSGAYDIKITAVDQDTVPLVCIEAKLNL